MMKELYYYNEAVCGELQVCPVIKETPDTYVVDCGFKRTVEKELMAIYDFKPTRFFETREQAEKSHLSFLKYRVISLIEEGKNIRDRITEYEALIKKLYGGKKK